MKKVLGCLRRADTDFTMIKDGDRIAVGVSGGKDSLLLLRSLRLYQYFSKAKFTIHALTLTMGLEPFDLTGVRAFCRDLDVPYTVQETQIGRILFEERKEKNPCSLCANMRRGALNDLAVQVGCNKVALGHHRDDAIETLLLSLFYEGRLHTFQPVTYLSRVGLTVIRPLLYVPEAHIRKVAREQRLPIVPSPCPANGATKRQEMKDLLTTIHETIPDCRDKMLSALRNTRQYGLWDRKVDIPAGAEEGEACHGAGGGVCDDADGGVYGGEQLRTDLRGELAAGDGTGGGGVGAGPGGDA